jgi:hypothetical protein
LDSSFDEVGDYKHRVIVQHLAYFPRQDGDLLDDGIDQCVLDAQTSQVPHEPVFYNAHETELAIPEGIPPAPAPSGPKVISKREPNYDQLRPFFGGLVLKSSRRLLNTLLSMLVFLLVHYLKRSINLLIQH